MGSNWALKWLHSVQSETPPAITNVHFILIFVVPSIMLYSSEIQDATIAFSFSAMALLYMFRVTISPIIRSTYAVYGHR